MTVAELLARWFDTRPGETRRVALSFFGAFCAISFLTLARALRETFFITTFGATARPYMTIAVAVLTLPAVGLFARAMGRRNPHVVYSSFLIVLAVMIGGIFVVFPAVPEAANISFYLVTVLGGSLLTSGFWMVTLEQFSLRQAKRLFGVIGAGGTLGAMLTGLLVSWLTRSISTLELLLPGLILLLGGVFVLQRFMPKLAPHHHHSPEESKGTPIREGLDLILARPHLRNIALIVFVATMVTTILDYQFVEVASNTFQDRDRLAGFFAAFFGLTGVLALLVQVFLAARLMSGAGIALSLAVLPSLLLLGSTAMLLVPASLFFWTTTAVRGADNSLRKSLHRSVLEYLYVPVPPTVRRKTKAFIDSVVDSVGGGIGAALLFLWVTWAGLSSTYLSFFVIGLSLAFIVLSLRMGKRYARTVRQRLAEGGETLEAEIDASGFDTRNLLTVTMSRLDLERELAKAGIDSGTVADRDADAPTTPESIEERLAAADTTVVSAALTEFTDWDETHVPAVIRLLARGRFYRQAIDILVSIGDERARQLIETLNDENADFVVRRRIPRSLSEVDTAEADRALLDALAAGRFEVRYRAAIALVRRRKAGLAVASGDWRQIVWNAIEREVGRDRPIWELQKILDGAEAGADDFVNDRVGVRGELSLEHTFRQLSLVLDADNMRTAFHGIILDDENLKNLSLEYLEQVLPPNIREALWPFIGDVSEYQRNRAIRGVDEVVHELSQTGATLFGGAEERVKLHDALRTYGEEEAKDGDLDGD